MKSKNNMKSPRRKLPELMFAHADPAAGLRGSRTPRMPAVFVGVSVGPTFRCNMHESVVERPYRDARLRRTYGDTTEIQRLIIGRCIESDSAAEWIR
jgi:alkylation response protein AidB-like acyl-CoA dehydrogenase